MPLTSHSLTPIALAALALLAERAMHPYEMFQLLLDRSEDRLLKVRRGTLYHAIAKLTETGLAAPVGTDRGGNRPERTTYAITPAGRHTLVETVRTMLTSTEPDYPPFPMALAEAHNLPAPEVAAALRDRIRHLADALAELESDIASARSRGVPLLYWVDLEYQHALRRTELEWLTRFVDDLTSGAVPWHPTEHSAAYPSVHTGAVHASTVHAGAVHTLVPGGTAPGLTVPTEKSGSAP